MLELCSYSNTLWNANYELFAMPFKFKLNGDLFKVNVSPKEIFKIAAEGDTTNAIDDPFLKLKLSINR